MALRTIREYGDEILTKKSKEIKMLTPRIRELIDDLWETMDDAEGVGLAAVQVGILKRVFVIGIDEEQRYCFINPVIEKSDGEQTDYEGCLSVPGKTGLVTRAEHVVVKAFDENMEPFTLEGEGLLARAIQHEYDHLDGHIYVEKVEGELYDAGSEPRDNDEAGDEAE